MQIDYWGRVFVRPTIRAIFIMHIEDNVNIEKSYRHTVHYLEGINLPGLPYNAVSLPVFTITYSKILSWWTTAPTLILPRR